MINLGEEGQSAVVGTDNVEDIAEYNFSGRHFRYKTADTHDLASSLDGLMHDDEQLKRNEQFSYEYIKKYMAAEIGAKQRFSVYENAIENKCSWPGFVRWYVKVAKAILVTSAKRRLDQVRKNA